MENKIRILSKIGKGTFGSVYKVKDIISGNIYALKKIPFTNSDEKDKQNIINELRILKFCNCPFLLTYHYSYVSNHHINIVTNFAKYSDLFKIINSHKLNKKKLEEDTIWNYFIQVALGIEYLHFNNIIHRDIKVANVFLDENDRIYLGDFGICKVLNIEQNLTDTQIGTPYYMSPEILEKKNYSKKIDIWSLGCLLYELIYFKPPFAGKDLSSLFKNVLKKKFDKSIDKDFNKSKLSNLNPKYKKHKIYDNLNKPFLPGIYDYNKYNKYNQKSSNLVQKNNDDIYKRNENHSNYSDELINLVNKILILDSKKRPDIEEILKLEELENKVKDIKNKYNYQHKEKIDQFQFKFNKIALPKYFHTWKIFIDQINKDDDYQDTPFPSPIRFKKKKSQSNFKYKLKSLDKLLKKDIQDIQKIIENENINKYNIENKKIKKNIKNKRDKLKEKINNKFQPCLPNILNPDNVNNNTDNKNNNIDNMNNNIDNKNNNTGSNKNNKNNNNKNINNLNNSIERSQYTKNNKEAINESSCNSHIKLPIIENKISTIEKNINSINQNIKDLNDNLNLLHRNRNLDRFNYKNRNLDRFNNNQNINRYFNNKNYNSGNNYKNNRRFQNNTEFKRFENHIKQENKNYYRINQRYLTPLF